jgi:hypothetical protein
MCLIDAITNFFSGKEDTTLYETSLITEIINANE